MVDVISGLSSAFFQTMDVTSFWGFSFLLVSVLSSVGLVVSVVRGVVGR